MQVRKERTEWRDLSLSKRHRRWGWDCPAVDLGFPKELTKPLRDFLSQPVADYAHLAVWQRNAEAEARP